MTREVSQALSTAVDIWDEVYAIALANTDDVDRAEELTRAYMSGWLRTGGVE